MAESRILTLAHRNAADATELTAASTTSLAIGLGSKTFIVAATTKAYVGARVRATRNSNSAQWMEGEVTAWVPSTGSLTVLIDLISGSATATDWTLRIDKWIGGDWETALPITNLEDERLWKVARSTDADPNNTRFRVDLTQSSSLQLMMALGTNLEPEARWRLRLFNIAPTTGAITIVYDTGKIDVWSQTVQWGQLPWGQFPYDGRVVPDGGRMLPPLHFTREMAELESNSSHSVTLGTKTFVTNGSTEDFTLNQPVAIVRTSAPFTGMLARIQALTANTMEVFVTDIELPEASAGGGGGGYLPSTYFGNYMGGFFGGEGGGGVDDGPFTDWIIRGLVDGGERVTYEARFAQLDLYDASNADAYIEVGRVFLGPVYEPTINMDEGFRIGWVDPSQRERARGGQLYVDQRRKHRRIQFRLGFLSRDEMLANSFELDRALGLSRTLIAMLDPGDSVNGERLTIYGNLAEMTDVEHVTDDIFAKPYIIEEQS